MEAELASEFDVIVVGTGFIESIVAAAAARIGKKVLHIDKNDYYGGQWASFTLQGTQNWVEEITAAPNTTTPTEEVKVEDGESAVALCEPNGAYSNVKQTWHVPEEVAEVSESQKVAESSPESPLTSTTEVATTEAKSEEAKTDTPDVAQVTEAIDNLAISEEGKAEESQGSPSGDTPKPDTKGSSSNDKKEEEKVWSQKEMMKLSRRFNLDLAPKLLYSRGPMVELLISSNVARYTEFKCITRVLTWVGEKGGSNGSGGSLVVVPCSRSDVFTSSAISLVEKRLLMKFLEFCSDYEKHQDQLKEFENKTFGEFLHSRRLTDNLTHFVTEAMAMVEPEDKCRVGLERTRLFLTSLGRYGSTPFLFSMYGCGELPQAFCRLCAVFEGTYVLRKPVSHVILSDGACVGIMAEERRFTCSQLVMGGGYAPTQYLHSTSTKHISRAIIITHKSMMAHEKDQLTLLRLPPDSNYPRPVTVVEVGQGGGVCPQGLYCIQLTCEGSAAESDLKEAVDRLTADNPPLWSLYFNQVDLSGCDLTSQCPSGVHLCPGPDSTLDYDAAISQAQGIFSRMFPEETFLPRAPDPEEIVFDNAGAEPAEGDQLGGEGGGEKDGKEGQDKSMGEEGNEEDESNKKNSEIESKMAEEKLESDKKETEVSAEANNEGNSKSEAAS